MGVKYDRFLDLFFTADNGWYDFRAQVEEQSLYQVQEHPELKNNRVLLVSNLATTGPGSISWDGDTGQLPTVGYVGVALKASELKNGDQRFTPLVEWVSATDHIGKVRLNAHGQEGGLIFMRDGVSQSIPANNIANGTMFACFLIQCGLENASGTKAARFFNTMRGIATITLALCHSGKSSSGVKSAVQMVAHTLGEQDFTDIDVTGSANTMAVRPSDDLVDQFMNIKADQQASGFRHLLESYLLYQLDDAAVTWTQGVSEADVDQSTRALLLQYQHFGRPTVLPASNDLVDLITACYKAKLVSGTSSRFPPMSKPGQLGHYVQKGDVQEWVRLKDSDEKIRIRSF
jgi:hypothetical protein